MLVGYLSGWGKLESQYLCEYKLRKYGVLLFCWCSGCVRVSLWSRVGVRVVVVVVVIWLLLVLRLRCGGDWRRKGGRLLVGTFLSERVGVCAGVGVLLLCCCVMWEGREEGREGGEGCLCVHGKYLSLELSCSVIAKNHGEMMVKMSRR